MSSFKISNLYNFIDDERNTTRGGGGGIGSSSDLFLYNNSEMKRSSSFCGDISFQPEFDDLKPSHLNKKALIDMKNKSKQLLQSDNRYRLIKLVAERQTKAFVKELMDQIDRIDNFYISKFSEFTYKFKEI